MGAGDVKLMAGVGAWMWGTVTLYAFAATGGGRRRHSHRHGAVTRSLGQASRPVLVDSWRDRYGQRSRTTAAIAAERKPRMFLLPYGIPIAIGTIAYFAWSGMLV